jgi:hypothetical protein
MGALERVKGPEVTRVESEKRVALVVGRARRAGEVVNAVETAAQRFGDGLGDVMLDQPEPGLAFEMRDVVPRPGVEVVEGNDLVSFRKQAVAEVRADETGSASD